MDKDKQLAANKLTSILGKLPIDDATTIIAFMDGLSKSLQGERTRVAELVLKFSKRTLAGIVFEDWHNSLSPEALSALSLRDFSRLVSMLLRDKPDQSGEVS